MPRPIVATYRLQFHAGFGFADAARVVPYLRDLGISHLYASPLFAARRGSVHGYDVVDPTRLNPELGAEADFDTLVDALHAHDMSVILDIVPNHMAASVENPWWHDVLARGCESPYADFFDIDWEGGDGKLVLPVLGKPLADALADGELMIVVDGPQPVLVYGGLRLPLRTPAEAGPNAASLERLLDAQPYRLAYWRETPPNYRRFFDINDLVGLRVEEPRVFEATHALALRLLREGRVGGLRIDHVDGLRDPAAYLCMLAERGAEECSGVRPYVIVEKILAPGEDLPHDWPVDGTTGYDFLAAANGVLVHGRALRALGRGYARLTRDRRTFEEIVYVNKRRVLRELFGFELAGLAERFLRLPSVVIPGGVGQADVEAALADVTACLPVYRTYVSAGEVGSPHGAAGRRPARAAEPAAPPISASDARYMRQAAEAARRRGAADGAVIEALERVALLRFAEGMGGNERRQWLDWVMRWQQVSGPAMAKGLEDTSFYQYHRLISLNEVGGHADAMSPAAFHRFNAARQRRWPRALNASSTHDTKRSEDVRARISALAQDADAWSAAVAAWSAAHDRLKHVVDGWRVPEPDVEAMLYQTLVGAWPLSAEDWNAFPERIRQFVTKAMREAKVHTSWTQPDEAYESAVLAFVDDLLSRARFRREMRRWVERVALQGVVNSLAQVVLKVASPGVPDFYQGTELWNLSLVDPDNRRPVDFRRRIELLDALRGRYGERAKSPIAELRKDWWNGRLKLFVTWKALAARRALPHVFEAGQYRPLSLSPNDPLAGDVVAFARVHGVDWVVAVVARNALEPSTATRLPIGRRAWGGGVLALPNDAPPRWTDLLTGQRVRVSRAPRGGRLLLAETFRSLPVALLHGRAIRAA